jgi:hypothetical protein
VALDAGPRGHAAAIVELVRNPPAPLALDMPTWDDGVDDLESLYSGIARSAGRFMRPAAKTVSPQS